MEGDAHSWENYPPPILHPAAYTATALLDAAYRCLKQREIDLMSIGINATILLFLPAAGATACPADLDALAHQRHVGPALLPRASRALHLALPLRGSVQEARGRTRLHRLGGGE